MPGQITSAEQPAIEAPAPNSSDDKLLREQALEQVQRVRIFKLHTVASFIGMLLLTCIWALTEYHNAGGWPHSFSQSSGTPGVWNTWIVWPWLAWSFITIVRAYVVYFRRPPSEAEIQREMNRMRRGPPEATSFRSGAAVRGGFARPGQRGRSRVVYSVPMGAWDRALARARGGLAVVVCALGGHAVLYRSLWPSDGVHSYFGWYEPAVGLLSAASLLLMAVLLAAAFLGPSSDRVVPLRRLLGPLRPATPGRLAPAARLAFASLLFLLVQESIERSVAFGRPAFVMFTPSALLLLLAALSSFAALVVFLTYSYVALLDQVVASARPRACARPLPPETGARSQRSPRRRSPLARRRGLRAPPLVVA